METTQRSLSLEQIKKSEIDAIAAIQTGNTARFGEIIERHQNRIISLLARQTGNQDIAEDLAQEVFIRALRGLKKFRFDADFSTWLVRIALNVSNSYFASKRYKERKLSDNFDPARHDQVATTTAADDEEVLADQRQTFRELLAELKPHLRETIVLCVFENKEYAEAAEILGIPIGTVRSRLNKAREILRRKLGRSISK